MEDEEIAEVPAAADRKRKASQLSDGGDADAVVKKLKAPPGNDLDDEDGDDLIILWRAFISFFCLCIDIVCWCSVV